MSISIQKFVCPHCNGEIPSPSRKRSCPYCKQIIYARTRPNGERVWVKEEDLAVIEKEWGIYQKRELFIREASENQNLVYNEFDKLIAKAKHEFTKDNRDKAWSLYNQTILKASNKFGNYYNSDWSGRFQRVYFSMACQLAAEKRYQESLPFFAKSLYWNCLKELIQEVNYQSLNLGENKQKEKMINFLPNLEQLLPPFILEPVITALEFAVVDPGSFGNLFIQENAREQELAIKLISIHEQVKFDVPKPEYFWQIIERVIKDNFEIRNQ